MCFNPLSTEDDAPTYVYVAVGSGVGIVVYILTIVLIGLVISLKIKGGYPTFTDYHVRMYIFGTYVHTIHTVLHMYVHTYMVIYPAIQTKKQCTVVIATVTL